MTSKVDVPDVFWTQLVAQAGALRDEWRREWRERVLIRYLCALALVLLVVLVGVLDRVARRADALTAAIAIEERRDLRVLAAVRRGSGSIQGAGASLPFAIRSD
jgi:hypothetical protein